MRVVADAGFSFCTFNIIDNEQGQHHFFTHPVTAAGQALPSAQGYDIEVLSRFWRAPAPVYRPDLHRDDPYNEREQEKGDGKRLSIVAISGNTLSEDQQRCLAAGMDACLVKPVVIKDLVEQMGRMDFSTGAETAPEHPPALTRAAALGWVEGDEALLAERVDTICRARAESMAAIEQALELADTKQLEAAAHAYRSILGLLGDNAAFSAADLEGSARKGQVDAMAYQQLVIAVEEYEHELLVISAVNGVSAI